MSAADFEKAVEYIRTAPASDFQPTNDQRLTFYKYFKQATEGDVTGSQPWAIELEKRAKWDAWKSVKGLSKDDAKAEYVANLAKLAPKWK